MTPIETSKNFKENEVYNDIKDKQNRKKPKNKLVIE